MSLGPCFAKLQRELRDFDTSDVREAAKAYVSRGKEDREANIAAIEDHLRELRANRAKVVDQVLQAWKERDPEGYAKAQRPALDLKSESEGEIRAREAQQAKESEQQRRVANAPSEKGFTLTGSDRPADEAEARGQKPMFARGPVYYSELARQVEAAKTASAPAAQWKAFIDNLASKGVKRDEIEWSGVKDWLDLQQGKVTREQVAQYLAENGVRVEETMLGGTGGADYERVAAEAATAHEKALALSREATKTMSGLGLSQLDRANLPRWLHSAETMRPLYAEEVVDANRKIAALRLPDKVESELREWARADIDGQRLADQRDQLSGGNETRYSQYKLPGGENYRELLLTLPPKEDMAPGFEAVEVSPGHWGVRFPDGNTIDGWRSRESAVASQRGQAGTPTFRSSHFDQPNILAHVRFDERTDADGKKVLFIQEIQSDWAQKGKREGFATEEAKRKVAEITEKMEALAKDRDPATNKMRDEAEWMRLAKERDPYQLAVHRGIPAAPFVGKTEAWVALAVKRMVRYAAENGFDRIAWTTGEQQAARYDLSKKVNRIEVVPRTDAVTDEKSRVVYLHLSDGRTLQMGVNNDAVVDNAPHGMSDARGKNLSEVVGKDIAEKVMSMERGTLRAADLKIGGEGMKAFYDKIVPNVVNDVLKKVGGGRVSNVILNADFRADHQRNEEVNLYRDKLLAKYGNGIKIKASPEELAHLRALEEGRATQPGFDITPAMRDEAMKGMPLFNRAKEALKGQGIPEDQVRQAIEPIVAKWTNAPDVKIIDSMDEAPRAVRSSDEGQVAQGAAGKPYAFFHEGTVYLIRSEIHSPVQAVEGLFHEALGHYGLRGVFGKDLQPLLMQIAAGRKEEVSAKAREYGLDPLKREDRLIAAEEVLAEMAQTRPELGIVKRAVAAVRNFMRDRGLDLAWSDNDIIQKAILPARNWVERGRSEAATEGTTFARAPAELEQKADELQSAAVKAREAKAASLEAPPPNRLGDALAKVFAPASRGKAAQEMAGVMRSNLAKQAHDRELAENQLRAHAKMFDKLPAEQNFEFIDAMEGGRPMADPRLQAAAVAIRKLLDGRRQQVIDLGKGKLENFIENYFPHIWKDPSAAAGLFRSFFGRRPLQGSKAFLKERTLDTFKQGLDAGLEPITSNPVELALLKAREMDRYIYGQKIFEEMKRSGLAKFVKFGDKAPDGWTKINDSIARVYTPTEQGTVIRGEYYAPEQAATLINNHLTPGLRGNAIFDMWRSAGNAMNSAQLGLGAFHLGFTTLDAMISRVALGVKQISRGVGQGKPGEVIRGIGTSTSGALPWQSLVNLYKGDRLLKAYLGELKDPGLAPVVEALVEGGGRVRMDPFYRAEENHNLREAWKLRRYGEVARKVIPRVIDAINWPIFEYLVPRQKLGVFFDMAQDALRAKPDMSLQEKRATFGKLWDSVDNRMGEMVYDNLFWDRALKDGLMATVRSVGWNLGTFRELGGGVKDLKSMLRNREFSDRTAYVLALPLVTAVIGAMTQYAYTGQGPQEAKDLFFPRTGRKRPDGSLDRVSLPSYMKDVYEYAHDAIGFAKFGADPTRTIKNKLHPLLSTVAQMLDNQDFFGATIRSPADPAAVQIADELKYLAKQVTPFGIRNYLQQSKTRHEEPTLAGYLTAGQFYGLGPAPGYVVHTPEQEESLAISRNRDAQVKKFRQDIKDGTAVQEVQRRMIAAGMSPRDRDYVLHTSGDTMRQHRLKHFNAE